MWKSQSCTKNSSNLFLIGSLILYSTYMTCIIQVHVLTIFNDFSVKSEQHDGIMLYHIRHMSPTKYISYRIHLCIQVIDYMLKQWFSNWCQ